MELLLLYIPFQAKYGTWWLTLSEYQMSLSSPGQTRKWQKLGEQQVHSSQSDELEEKLSWQKPLRKAWPA